MKISKFVIVAGMVALAQGCISFDMGPAHSFPDSAKREELTVQSLKRVVSRITKVGYNGSDTRYKLELVAEGSFIKHNGHTMNKGTPCLSVGFWPGLSGSKNKGELFFFSILGIYPFCGLPTLCSLVCEPFRDYRVKPDSGVGDMADVGLLGFNKYYRDIHRDSTAGFVSVSTERISRYVLYAYSVEIDGVRYQDRDAGRGYEGAVYFRSSRPRGSKVVIRIADPPASRSDGGDGFSGLQGLVLMGTIP